MSSQSYIDRLLEFYLQAGIIEKKWIPQIKEHVAEHGRAYIPARDGIERQAKTVHFSFAFTKKDGEEIRVFPVTEKPWATFYRVGEKTDGPLKGLCMWMPDAFFETHGRDGLPLDL